MRLEITAGPDAGKEIEPEGERCTVGREGVDFLLSDDEVSRRHFELRTLPDGRLEITDLGSRNGTHVNGERLTGPRTLEGGEEIRVGVTTIVAEAPPPPPPPDPGATKVSAEPPPTDPDATAAAAEVPPELRADESAPREDDVTAPRPVAPPPPEPATPPPPPPAPEPPAPPPAPRAAPPPPPRRPAPGAPPGAAGQASTGLRVTALVLSIVAVLAGVFALIVVGVALSLDLCDDVAFGDCYDGSSGARAIGSILSVLGAIASVAFLVFAIRYFSKSRSPMLVLASGIATVLLLGIGLAVI